MTFNDKKSIRRIVEVLGGQWGQIPLELKYEGAELTNQAIPLTDAPATGPKTQVTRPKPKPKSRMMSTPVEPVVFIIIGNRKSKSVRQSSYLVPTVPDLKLQLLPYNQGWSAFRVCKFEEPLHALVEESVEIIITIASMRCISCN